MASKRLSKRELREQKRQKRIRVWMSIIIVSILVISSFALVLMFTPQTSNAPFSYEIRDNQLLVRTDQGVVPFVNFPQDGLLVSSELFSDANFVYVSFDPFANESLSFMEFARFDLSEYMTTVDGVLQSSSQYPSLPVISCEDASAQNPVIILSEGNRSVQVNEYCVEFSATGTDFYLVRDSILYAHFDLI